MANYPTGPASTKSSFQGRFTADRRGPGTLLTLLAGCGIWGEPPPTSLLLISVDTLRPDHLGCYDYHRDTSPNIDAFAADGVLFEQAVSSTSWTLPAHAAMFTGLSDSVHGCTDTDRSLAQAHRTLAERLAEAGYQTAGFYSGPYLHAVFGLDQGFERWVDCTSYPELNDQKAEHEGTVDGREVWKASHADVTNPTVLREVRGWMEEDPQEPFFAFVHLWDTHYDFLPPSPWDTMFDPDYDGEVTGEGFMFDPRIRPGMPQRDLEHLLALYDGEIAWTDHHVGGILELLEERGLDDHTLVVLLSDHGTAFFEHGQKIHRNALYDELIRIPLIMRLPGSLPTGLRVQDQARTIDLVPTVLELLGFPSAEDVMGQSLTPAWRPDTDLFQEPAISELHSVGHALRSYRHPERKIIVDEERRRLLLYDLTADPGEQSPMRQKQSTDGLGARLVEDWKQGERSLEESRTRLAPPTTTAEPTLDDDVRGQLRELGYID